MSRGVWQRVEVGKADGVLHPGVVGGDVRREVGDQAKGREVDAFVGEVSLVLEGRRGEGR